MIDPSQVFNPQPTTYPVHPLVQLLQSALGMQQFRETRQQRQEEKKLAEEERKRIRLGERYNFYIQQYAQDPRGAFRAAYEDNPEFRDLAKQLYGFAAEPGPAVAPPQGAFGESQVSGPGVGPAQLGTLAATQTYKLPGPPPPAFRTVGELAKRFGLTLRPGVDPNLPIDQLPRGFDLNQLLIDPEALREQERAAARARLEQATKIYSVQQIFSTPALRDPFLRDYQLVFGQPFPTQKMPETVTIPGQRTEEGGLSRFLAPSGTQQIPTGRQIEQPILPEAAKEIMVNVPGVGQVPLSSLPAGAQTGIINRMFDQASKVEVTLKNGQKIMVSPEKAADLDRQQQVSMVTFRDPSTGAVVTVPATAIPSFFPRRAPGAAGDQAGLTTAEKRLLDNYNKLVDQRTRLLQIAASALDEDSKRRAMADIAVLDKRILQLQPGVDKILGVTGEAPGPVKSLTMAEVEAIARAENKPVATVIADAQRQGYTVVGAPAGAPRGAVPRSQPWTFQQAQQAVVNYARAGRKWEDVLAILRRAGIVAPDQLKFLQGLFTKNRPRR